MIILMGNKEIDPNDIRILSFDKTEMELNIDVELTTDQNGKKLNKKEKDTLADWLTSADDMDVRYDWHDMFGDRL